MSIAISIVTTILWILFLAIYLNKKSIKDAQGKKEKLLMIIKQESLNIIILF